MWIKCFETTQCLFSFVDSKYNTFKSVPPTWRKNIVEIYMWRYDVYYVIFDIGVAQYCVCTCAKSKSLSMGSYITVTS